MKPLVATALIVLAGLLAAPVASARDHAIIRDCSGSPTGELQGSYSKEQLLAARKQVKGDIAEYTNCYDAINNALRRPAGSSGGTPSGTPTPSDGSAPSNVPAPSTTVGAGGEGTTAGNDVGGVSDSDGGALPEPAATAEPAPAAIAPEAHQSGSGEAIEVAHASITPSIPATLARDGRDLPAPLVGFLILLGVGSAGVAVTTFARRALSHWRD